MQDFKRTPYWPNLVLLSKKNPSEISEEYPIWKNEEQEVVRGAAAQRCTGRRALAGRAARGNCCFI